MGPFGIVEVDPIADDPFGHEAVRQFVQIDCLVFERPPQALDEIAQKVRAPRLVCLTSAPMEQISGIVFGDIIFQLLGKQTALLAVHTLNETLHQTLPPKHGRIIAQWPFLHSLSQYPTLPGSVSYVCSWRTEPTLVARLVRCGKFVKAVTWMDWTQVQIPGPLPSKLNIFQAAAAAIIRRRATHRPANRAPIERTTDSTTYRNAGNRSPRL